MTSKFAVLVNLQFVGINIIYTPAFLQILAKERESSAQYGDFISTALQYSHQAVGTFGDRQVLCYLLHHADVKTFKQCHALGKALLEVYLAAHGSCCYFLHLVTYASTHRQFVDALCLYKGGIHIEANQTAHSAEHIVFLEREVHFHSV